MNPLAKYLFQAAFIAAIAMQSACAQSIDPKQADDEKNSYPVEKTDEEWLEILGPEAFRVLREKGTERAFTGEYNDWDKKGSFQCAGCGHKLFHSDHKYDSGSGWPSFWRPIKNENLDEDTDHRHGWTRKEVLCGQCGGHLGHVFRDGPKPSGLRYCVNSISLDFVPDGEE